MKKLLLLFVFFQFQLSAQNYNPFPRQGLWNTDFATVGPFNIIHHHPRMYFTAEDSIVNNLTYQVIRMSNDSSLTIGGAVALIREQNQKVYCLYNNYFPGEIVLYDFTLAAGDTFNIPTSTPNIDTIRYVVTAVDSELTATGYRPAINLDIVPTGFLPFWVMQMRWVEGIGDIKNCVIYPEVPTVDWWMETWCFYDSTTQVWAGQQGYCWLTGTKEINAKPFSIFPNPSNYILNIDLKNEEVDQVKVYFIDGSLILKKNVTGNNLSISKQETGSGIFIIQLCGDKAIYNEKVVFY